jgi:hypothetical protein
MLDNLFDDSSLSPFGEDSGGVLDDVSNSSPAEQPSTPTGTGTGMYIPSNWEAGLMGGLHDVLNYALARGQAEFAAKHGYAPGNAKMTATPQAQAAIGNSRLLIIGAIVVAAALVLRK